MKIIFFLYGLFLFLFTLFSYLFVDINLIYLKPLITGFFMDQRLAVVLGYTLFIGLFFIFYLFFLLNFKKEKLNLDSLRKLIILSFALLILSYPAIVSYDIFNYIGTAKVLFHYAENPYILMPIQFVHDPILFFMHAANKVALYGPFWIVLTGIPFVLSFGNFIASMFLFKILSSVFYFATIYLIYKITKSVYWTAFVALNPLVVFETSVSGHNDFVMIFFAILAFCLISKNKTTFSLFSILLSILVKFATIFLLPVFLYTIYLKRAKQNINWPRIYLLSGFSMLIIFLLSPLREEIYPWYAIWFLVFIPIATKNRIIEISSIIFSFSLMLRYIPFMYLGTYFGPTPLIKILVTFVPVFAYLMYKVIFKYYNAHIVKK